MSGGTLCIGLALLASAAPSRPVDERTLDNGLRVLVEARPGSVEVGVAVAYPVGQRDDPDGYGGLAHLAEHMAFRGTRHLPDLRGYQAISDLGGQTGASTGFDVTVYRHTVPAAALATSLWVESDRMGYLVEALDAGELELEKRIVAREIELRRGPALGPNFLMARLFPEGHPYHVGDEEIADVAAVTLPGLQGFLQRRYRPDLAAIAVVGDVASADVFAAVERYFGELPRPSERAPARRTDLPPRHCFELEGAVKGRGRVMMIWRFEDPGPPGLVEVLAGTLEAAAQDSLRNTGATVDVASHRWDLETLVHLTVRASGPGLGAVQGPLRRMLGELDQRVTPALVDRGRRKVSFGLAREQARPTARAEAWATSMVSQIPSPAALEAGIRSVPIDAILRRARRLSGGRPDFWVEARGLVGREFPDAPRYHRTPCRRL